ncbi:Peroxidase [Mycena sanguinolenta]|uniref:Peroxidase n=1 Tax=Mycena sanguinolenta TaxID=230812 RepID=A0A8H6XZS4_9AGAR|nr:Peroxidase [Mycena sanguinolenta]
MLLNLPLSLLSSCFLWLAAVQADYHWPSLPYDAYEEFFVRRLSAGRVEFGTARYSVQVARRDKYHGRCGVGSTCSKVYHDVATHNITDGTGGLDGSIFFEIDRVENVGAGMNNTINDFSTYPSKYLTRADIIAIATVFAVATCSGPVIPFRGGRVDANIAGPYGVPNASDPIDSLTSNFAHQGFNTSEMIQLVACGHTLGGVRYPDFPDVVSGSGSTTIVDLFDETQQFDHNIVSQYLDGSTRDPLLVLNQTMASDLRVFSSDGNVTMQSMNSADSFAQACATVFDKMLNTVPSDVTLTDEITLVPFKVSAVQLTVGTSQLQFQASVRLEATQSTTVKMYWCDRYGSAANCSGNVQRFAASGGSQAVSSPVTTAMGITLEKYSFVVPVNASQSISKFWFVVDYGNGTTVTADNGGTDYVIDQDEVLWVPSMSTDKSVLDSSVGIFIAAAVKSSGSTPSRVYIDCFGRATSDFLPVNATYDLTLNTSIPAVAGYDFYTGTATASFGATMQFDLYAVDANGTSYVDEYRQSGLIGVALVAASSVNSTTSGTVPGGVSGAESVSLRNWSSRWGVGMLGVSLLWTLRYI